MIQFDFRINRSFLNYSGHPITVPSAYNEELESAGLHQTTDVPMEWFGGKVLQGSLVRSSRPGTRDGRHYPYYQITVRGKFPPELLDGLALNQIVAVQIRSREDFKIILHYTGARNTPVAIDISDTMRVPCLTYRILRDTEMARQVKAEWNYECQICRKTLMLDENTPYAEAHHVRPLGSPQNGPDVRENILCVCPNDHALLDNAAIYLKKAEFPGIRAEFIDYHNELVDARTAKWRGGLT